MNIAGVFTYLPLPSSYGFVCSSRSISLSRPSSARTPVVHKYLYGFNQDRQDGVVFQNFMVSSETNSPLNCIKHSEKYVSKVVHFHRNNDAVLRQIQVLVGHKNVRGVHQGTYMSNAHMDKNAHCPVVLGKSCV